MGGREIVFENKNGRISDFQGLVTLTLTLDRVTLHTVMHHSSNSTYIPNFIEIKETFVDGRTDRRTDTLLGRLGGVDLIIVHFCSALKSEDAEAHYYKCQIATHVKFLKCFHKEDRISLYLYHVLCLTFNLT